MTTTEYDTSHDTGQAETWLVRLLRQLVEKSDILQHRIERQALSAPAEASDCAECPYHFGQGSSRSVH